MLYCLKPVVCFVFVDNLVKGVCEIKFDLYSSVCNNTILFEELARELKYK
jgi:hypothetical protein